jgi:cytochrome oxidase Cu insertion factor (SCO1/SenC/PrrC family)
LALVLLRRVATTIGATLVGVLNAATRQPVPLPQLKPGDAAPDFALTGSDGQIHRLKDLAGQPVVIAWFPKAFTGG